MFVILFLDVFFEVMVRLFVLVVIYDVVCVLILILGLIKLIELLNCDVVNILIVVGFVVKIEVFLGIVVWFVIVWFKLFVLCLLIWKLVVSVEEDVRVVNVK